MNYNYSIIFASLLFYFANAMEIGENEPIREHQNLEQEGNGSYLEAAQILFKPELLSEFSGSIFSKEINERYHGRY